MWNWKPIYDENGLLDDIDISVEPLKYRRCTEDDRQKFYSKSLESKEVFINKYFLF